jgi:hypothetical protein
MKPQLLSGARGKVVVNGQTLAFITDISVDAPQQVRSVHTFGSPAARSIEPLSAGPCTVTLGGVVPVNKPDGSRVDSSAIGLGIEPMIQTLLTSDDITVELIDKITGATFASVRNCRFQNRSLSLGASALAQQRITLMGIYDAASGNSPGKLGFDT